MLMVQVSLMSGQELLGDCMILGLIGRVDFDPRSALSFVACSVLRA